jgi:hypothetical protein
MSSFRSIFYSYICDYVALQVYRFGLRVNHPFMPVCGHFVPDPFRHPDGRGEQRVPGCLCVLVMRGPENNEIARVINFVNDTKTARDPCHMHVQNNVVILMLIIQY